MMRDRLVIIDAVKELMKVEGHPLSRGYCFSWCAKQKRHQRTNARSYAQEVGESLRRVFGCHSVSAFRKKSPQRKIIVSSFSSKTIVIFSSKTIVIFFILFPNWKVEPTNFYQEKMRCGLGSGGADLALEVRTWEMRKNEKIKSAGPKSADLDVCMYTWGLRTLVRHSNPASGCPFRSILSKTNI